MNASWWLWTWCMVLVNVLVSQLTDNNIVALTGGLVELLLTVLVAARNTTHRYRASNLLIILATLLGAVVLLLPFGGLGMTIPVINSITVPESWLRLLYLRRLLIVPWLVFAYAVVLWLWSHFINPRLRDYFANDQLHDFPFKTLIISAVVVTVAILAGNAGPDRLLACLYLVGGTMLIAFWAAWLIERLTALPLKPLPKPLLAALIVVGCLLCIIVGVRANHDAQVAANAPRPVIISHRGVDHRRGVQNTVQSLKLTAREHPQMVEADTQESRDHHFIMMHDPNLHHLAHQKWQIDQRNLQQLTHTNLHEHGYTTKLSTFNHYLSVANKHHVPLIVEIKPQNLSPAAVVHDFLATYSRAQKKDHFMIHSVDPQIIRKVEKEAPNIKTGLIQPF